MFASRLHGSKRPARGSLAIMIASALVGYAVNQPAAFGQKRLDGFWAGCRGYKPRLLRHRAGEVLSIFSSNYGRFTSLVHWKSDNADNFIVPLELSKLMRAACISSLAAWMLVLAITGWCCHPRACCAPICQDSYANASTVVTHCCRHCGSETRDQDDQSAPSNDESVPSPCERGCQGVCTYLPSQQVSFDVDEAPMPFETVDILSTSANSQFAISLWMRKFESSRIEPAQRLHLLHQIFLI